LPPEFVEALDNLVRADLLQWRDMWFHWLLVSTGIVAVGLALEGPELWHEIRHIRLDRRDRRMFFVHTSHEVPPRWKVFAFCGWILIVIGVMGEGIFEGMVSRADSQVQTFDNILLEAAQKAAGAAAKSAKIAHEEADAVKGIADEARADAKDALAKAQAAQRELAHAETDAARAQAVSSNALNKSTEAESHLRDAMQLASEAQAELKRVTLPRQLLTQSSQVVTPLKAFKDQEYVFSAVAADGEALRFLVQIDALLKAAGWKRAKSLPVMLGIPNLKPNVANDPDLAVPESLTIGVDVATECTCTPAQLTSIPMATWPRNVQAAAILNNTLFLNTLPPRRPSDSHPSFLKTGPSTVVSIDVGKR